MTPQEFAAKIRAKYPGAYDSVPDDVLTQKVIEKYPIYASQVKVEEPAQKGVLEKVGGVVNSIFPGKKLGEAIGTSVAATERLLAGDKQGFNDVLDTQVSPLQVGGDVAQAVLTAGAPVVGKGAGLVGRIGVNAGLGAGLGSAGAVAEGDVVSQVAKEGAIGAALGGGISGGVELGSSLSKNLPRWFTKLALPKLSQGVVKGTPEETVEYALKNTKGVSLKQMYNNSVQATKSYENQVQAVLNLPEYAAETGSKTVVGDVLDGFKNANLQPDQVIKYAKQVAPAEKALIDKVANGVATLIEKNELRKALDIATKKRFTDNPNVGFAKEVGGKLADVLRADVKGVAKETEPIFAEYAKEQALKVALLAAAKKKRVAGPLLAGTGGFAGGFAKDGLMGGLSAGLTAVLVEEGIRSPEARLMTAKIIQKISKLAPAGRAVTEGAKAPLIKSATDRK